MQASNANMQFFLRINMRIAGVHVYTVNIQKNEDHDIWSQHLKVKKKKKGILGEKWKQWE